MEAVGRARGTLFLLHIASCVSLGKTLTDVYIGGLFPTLPNKANVPGFLLEIGTNLALEHVNNDSSILSQYRLKVTKADSKCDPKVSFDSLVDLLANPPNKLVIYGAACSDVTGSLARSTALANVVQISHTSTSVALSDAKKYPSLYRPIPTHFAAIKACIFLLKRFNWTRVAIIGEKTGSGLLGDTYNAIVQELQKHEVDIQWMKIITSNEIQGSISKIKEKDVRIILTAVTSTLGKKIISEAFEAGVYGPQYVWIWLETFRPMWWSSGNKTKDKMLKNVVHYSFGFGGNLNVLDNTTSAIGGRTPRQIWLEYLRRLNITNFPLLAAYSYDGVWFIAKALDAVVKDEGVKLEDIKTGNESFYQLLKSKMKSVTFSGVTGKFEIYSEEIRERLDGPVHIYQYDQGGNAIEVMAYDVSHNHAVVKTGNGYLWRDGYQIPKDNRIIYFGGLFPSLPNKANVPGILLEVGTNLALEHVNRDPSMLSGYTLKMTKADSKCDPKVSFNSLVNLLANPPNKLVIYGAACSDVTASLARSTAMANVVQVSHTSTSVALSDAEKYPSLYRPIPTDFPAIKTTMALLNMFNWTRVAIIGEKTRSGLLEETYDATIRELVKHNIDIEWKKIITSNEIEKSISELKNKDVRIILTAVSSTFAKKLISQALDAGVNSPKYVWIWLETFRPMWWSSGNKTLDKLLKNVVHYSFGFGDNLNVLDEATTTVSGRTPRQIWLEYLHRLNITNFPLLAAYSYDGVWFIAKALDAVVKDEGVKLEDIKTGNESFYQLLKSKMKSVTFYGLTGEFKIYTDEIRERLDGPVHIYQHDRDGSAVAVMTYDISNNRIQIMKGGQGYLWKDKEQIPADRKMVFYMYQREMPKEWIFILLTILCVLSIFLSFIFIIYLLVLVIRKKGGKYTAIFNIVISTGCVCLCIAGILFGLRVMDKLDDLNGIERSCKSQFGLTSIGLTLVLGAIFSKLLGISQMRDNDISKMSLSNGSERVPYNEFCAKKYPDWLIMIYIFHSVQAVLSIVAAVITKGKSSHQVDDGALTRCCAFLSFLLVNGVILSDVPSRDHFSSLKTSYTIFTSVVSGCTLIILLLLFVLKACCTSDNTSSTTDVRLTNVKLKETAS